MWKQGLHSDFLFSGLWVDNTNIDNTNVDCRGLKHIYSQWKLIDR